MTKKFDPTKPVQTRDGRKARIICTDVRDDYYPIMALVQGCTGEYAMSYTGDGSHHHRSHVGDLPDDLINIPPAVVHTGYRVISTGGGMTVYYSNLIDAINSKNALTSACGIIKITTYDDNTFDVEKVES